MCAVRQARQVQQARACGANAMRAAVWTGT